MQVTTATGTTPGVLKKQRRRISEQAASRNDPVPKMTPSYQLSEGVVGEVAVANHSGRDAELASQKLQYQKKND